MIFLAFRFELNTSSFIIFSFDILENINPPLSLVSIFISSLYFIPSILILLVLISKLFKAFTSAPCISMLFELSNILLNNSF